MTEIIIFCSVILLITITTIGICIKKINLKPDALLAQDIKKILSESTQRNEGIRILKSKPKLHHTPQIHKEETHHPRVYFIARYSLTIFEVYRILKGHFRHIYTMDVEILRQKSPDYGEFILKSGFGATEYIIRLERHRTRYPRIGYHTVTITPLD